MRRQSISASEYAVILSELVVTAMHMNAMSVTLGTHETYGRVVLLRSGTAFVVIADRLHAPQDDLGKNHVLTAVTRWAETAGTLRS